MLSFKIRSDELQDRFLVPFYQVLKLTKKYPLTIEQVAKQITNGIDLREYKEEGTPYLRGMDIKRCQVDMPSAKLVNFSLDDVPEKIKLKEGDILITRKGTVGVTSIVSSDCKDVIIGTEIIKVRLKKDAPISPEYFYTLINSKIGMMQIYSKMTGTLSRGINHPSLKTVKIPTLAKADQEKIDLWVKEAKKKHTLSLSIIEDTLKIIEDKFGKFKSKEENYYKISCDNLNEAFTPKFYYPKYVKTINNIKSKFKTEKLGDIANISKGKEVGSENYRTYLDKQETDVPFMRTSDLPNFELDDYPDYYVDESIYEGLNQKLEEGDIVFTKDGKIGATAFITNVDKCILSSGLSIIKPYNKEDTPYIFAILSSFIGKFQAQQHTVISSTLPHLNRERLADFEIPIMDDEFKEKIKENIIKAFQLKKDKKLLIRQAKKLIEKKFLED